MSRNLIALAGIIIITFVAMLDYSIVNTALPTIQRVFSISVLSLQWVFNIYCIVVAFSMVIAGRLGDLLGKRKVFYLGVLGLFIGSLGAGLSDAYWMLLFFRVIQSFGVAAIIICGSSLINDIFRGSVDSPMSAFAAIGGLGLMVGPYVGGVIVMHFGWRWIFWVNVPLLVVGMLFCLPSLDEYKDDKAVALDLQGGLLIAIVLTSLIYGMLSVERVGFTNVVAIGSLLVFVVSVILLYMHERHQAQPIMNFSYFTRPKFLYAVLGTIMCGVLISPAVMFVPLVLQNGFAYTPKMAGLILLVSPAVILLFAPVIGKLSAKVGAHRMMIYALLSGLISSVIFMFYAWQVLMIILIFALIFMGLCWAVTNTCSAISAASAVEPHESGLAIGTVFSFWNSSAAVSIGITSVIFHAVTTSGHFQGPVQEYVAGFRAIFYFIMIACIVLLSIALLKRLRNQ